MKKENRPFYKRGWFIGLAVFLAFGYISGMVKQEKEEERAEAEKQEEKEKAETEQKSEEEKEQTEKEKKEEEESKPETIELDDFAMAEFSIEEMSATIEDEI